MRVASTGRCAHVLATSAKTYRGGRPEPQRREAAVLGGGSRRAFWVEPVLAIRLVCGGQALDALAESTSKGFDEQPEQPARHQQLLLIVTSGCVCITMLGDASRHEAGVVYNYPVEQLVADGVERVGERHAS